LLIKRINRGTVVQSKKDEAKTSYVPTTKLEDLAHNKVVKREFCNRTKKTEVKEIQGYRHYRKMMYIPTPHYNAVKELVKPTVYNSAV
jgi:hypothetical protein